MTEQERIISVMSAYKNHSFGDKAEKVTVEEIIALLKAQEPVKPVWHSYDEHLGFFACGACGMNMGTNPKYCWYCGKKVKWE